MLLSQPLYHCVPWLVLGVFSDFTPQNAMECVLVWRGKRGVDPFSGWEFSTLSPKRVRPNVSGFLKRLLS